MVFCSLEQGFQNDDDDIKEDLNANLIDKNISAPETNMKRVEFFHKLIGKNFNQIEKSIVYYYYYRNLTMDKVALKLGLSESRVSQIHKKILPKLKNKIKNNTELLAYVTSGK